MQLPTAQEIGFSSDAGFVKIESGQSMAGVLRGAPVFFKQVWNEGEEKQVFSMDHQGGAKRFRMNFLTYSDGQWSALILENGPRLYAQIEEENSMRPIENSVVKLTRNGSGKNTTWDLRFVKEVPEEARAVLDNVELLDLNPFGSKENHSSNSMGSEQPSFTESDVPF